jgi:hypothetical protein
MLIPYRPFFRMAESANLLHTATSPILRLFVLRPDTLHTPCQEMLPLSSPADDEVSETLKKDRVTYMTKSISNRPVPPLIFLPKVKAFYKRDFP